MMRFFSFLIFPFLVCVVFAAVEDLPAIAENPGFPVFDESPTDEGAEDDGGAVAGAGGVGAVGANVTFSENESAVPSGSSEQGSHVPSEASSVAEVGSDASRGDSSLPVSSLVGEGGGPGKSWLIPTGVGVLVLVVVILALVLRRRKTLPRDI